MVYLVIISAFVVGVFVGVRWANWAVVKTLELHARRYSDSR